MLEIAKVYPLDAVFDTPEDVPEDVSGSLTELAVLSDFQQVILALSCFP